MPTETFSLTTTTPTRAGERIVFPYPTGAPAGIYTTVGAVLRRSNTVLSTRYSLTFGDSGVTLVPAASFEIPAGSLTLALDYTESVVSGRSNVVDVRAFGAVADNATDCTAAFTAAYAAVQATYIDYPSEDVVTRYLIIPPGQYLVTGSVNWSNATQNKPRNLQIIAWGAVIRGTGSGKNIIDFIGNRFTQVHGLTIYGDDSSPPKCGILLGPNGTATSGNNYFNGLTVTGTFTKSAVHNIGSETTTWVRCRMLNASTASDAYAFIGDGMMEFGATSDYQTLRSQTTQVSFTNNTFYACDFRNNGGGTPVLLECVANWTFDRACYFVSFNTSTVQIYSRTGRTINLYLAGLFENAQADFPSGSGNLGCAYTVEFIGNATNQEIVGFECHLASPHARIAAFRMVSFSTATMTLRNANISINRLFTQGIGAVFFNTCTTLTICGNFTTNNPAEVNFNQIAAFNGRIFVKELANFSPPPAGSYQVVAETGGQLIGGLANYSNDAAAATGGVPIGGLYRNGSGLQVRVT